MLNKGSFVVVKEDQIQNNKRKMEVNLLFTVLVSIFWERAGGREANSRPLYHIKSKQVG